MKIALPLVVLCFLLASCSTPTTPPPPREPIHNEVKFSGEYFEVLQAKPPPTLVRPVQPVYPAELRRANYDGEVWLQYIVEKDGSTGEVQVERANHPGFANAAVAAIRQWKFRPGMVDGKPARIRVKQVLTFNINVN